MNQDVLRKRAQSRRREKTHQKDLERPGWVTLRWLIVIEVAVTQRWAERSCECPADVAQLESRLTFSKFGFLLDVVSWRRLVVIVVVRRGRLFVVEVTPALVSVNLGKARGLQSENRKLRPRTYLPRIRRRPRCQRANGRG